MHRRTKIICTMGPAVRGVDKVLELIDAGMNVARLNFSHGTHEEHRQVILDLKKAREIREVPLAILLDTKGPEIRVGVLKEEKFSMKRGQKVELVTQETYEKKGDLPITPGHVIEELSEGARVLFDDGLVAGRVCEVREDSVIVEIANEGDIKSKKGVNVPNVDIDLPAITQKDREDIIFGCQEGVDLIAASFIRSADHILMIKRFLVEQGKGSLPVIAKIENSLGVQNFDFILQVSDGIMVARGDLGVELPVEQVPHLQKMMVRRCYQVGKPAVIATQMLESMIQNPRPTRAEVSDVANAIYDSTSSVMLSGETAVGKYPIAAVNTMRSIVQEAEKDFTFRDFFRREGGYTEYADVSLSVALASVKAAYNVEARAIFVLTSSGMTARLISRFRPYMPILALSTTKEIYHQLAFMWGVIPVDPMIASDIEEAFGVISSFTVKRGIAEYGDLVVLTAGYPFGLSGTTNTMMIESLGNVLVRGRPSSGKSVHGKIAIVHSAEHRLEDIPLESIIVLSRCDSSYDLVFERAKGVILQNYPEDIASEESAIELANKKGIPLIARAEHALEFLKEGQAVTIDPEKGIIYKGAFLKGEGIISSDEK